MSFLSYTQQMDDNLIAFLVSDHERYRPVVEFFDTMTRDLNELSWAEAELIAAEVSRTNGSRFCSGIRGGMMAALPGARSDPVEGKLQALLEFARKVNRASTSVTQDDIDKLLSEGWREKTVEDVVGLVAIQQLYNTLATGLGFNNFPASGFEQIGRDTVDAGGYLASFRSFVTG